MLIVLKNNQSPKRLLFYLLLIRRQDPSVLDEVLPLTLPELTLSFATLPIGEGYLGDGEVLG